MTATERDVAVIGAGVKAPGGCSLDELWARLLAGRTAVAPYRHPGLPEAASVVVGLVGDLDVGRYVTAAELQRLDRIHLLAIGAADDALAGCADRPASERCAVVCGVGYGAAAAMEEMHRTVATSGMRGLSPLTVPLNMVNSAAAHLAIRYGFEGPCLTVSTACASGADAIGQGVGLLRSGAADLVLAGGVDAAVELAPVLSFFRMGALSANIDPATASRPFDVDRDGFVLGEGAGFVLLQRRSDALDQGREVMGWVNGYCAGCEAHHIVAPRSDGDAARRCATGALDDARVDPADVGHVNAHGTSTPRNDVSEGRAMAAVFTGRCPPVTAVKGVTGHLIGGSGAVEAIVTLLSLRTGLVPAVAGFRTPDPAIPVDIVSGEPREISAKYAISNSFGFGGHNAVLVLGAP